MTLRCSHQRASRYRAFNGSIIFKRPEAWVAEQTNISTQPRPQTSFVFQMNNACLESEGWHLQA
ncbi:hypothetical protein CPC08DRAFT_702134 [Agrocybe pediades]|nr:hypothetical protein CPC08DRAFT_702134 [Agrocybe pediades]